MKPSIIAIDHVQITVPPDAEAAVKSFYGDILGLMEILKPEALRARGGIWYQIGDTQLHIGIEETANGNASRRHLCFRVADLEQARQVIAQRGVEIIPEPIQPDGLQRFFVRDPAGNRIEIGQRA